MKKNIRYILYFLITIYSIYFISAICTYCYQIWDDTAWAHQEYSMDSLSLASFKSKYIECCQNKGVIKSFCSPYHNNIEKVKFISQEKDGMIDCSFYSKELKVLMKFYAKKESSLKIYYWGIVHSCNNNLTPEEYAWNINGGSKTWTDNSRFLKAFENEVLSNIGCYKRDFLQGFLCWYPFFFVNHFFYFFLLGVLLIALVVRIKKTDS